MDFAVFTLMQRRLNRIIPSRNKGPVKSRMTWRRPYWALSFGILAIIPLGTALQAREILLSDFSGYETVVTMSEIPRTNLNIEAPSDAWLKSRLVKGIYLRGGHEIRLPGSLRPFESPFASPPTAGDPAGFSTASQGVALEFQYGLTLDFRWLEELPQRVGFLSSFNSTYQTGPGTTANNPNLRMGVSINQGNQPQTYSYEAGTRLFAFEEVSGIRELTITMSGLIPTYYGTYSPWVTLDDIRFESFPYGADVTVSAGLMTQGQAGFPSFDNDEPLRKRGEGTLVLDAANLLSGPTEVMQGGVLLAHPSALSRSPISVSDGAVLGVANRVNASIPSLELGSSALVDISTGSLEIANGFTPDGIKARLLQGRADGTWTGSAGITSSAVVADIGNSVARTVGWKASADGSVTVAYSAPGDTNIDGEVNVFDLVGVNSSGTYGKGNASVWSQGDFDYNGVTNVFDLVLTNGAGVYGRGNYLPVAAPAGVSVVPEPCLCPLAIAGIFYLTRRNYCQRKHRKKL